MMTHKPRLPVPQLDPDMTLSRVRKLLADWKPEPLIAVQADDGKFHSVWDFIPPPDLKIEPLRLMFVDNKLAVQGTRGILEP